MAYQFLILVLTFSATLSLFCPVSGQIVTAPCTPSMITTFSPCMSFVTNNSLNGTTPPADCCNSLKSLMSNGKDCLCLMFTGSVVPFRIPINRTAAISLPRSCNMPGVPLQCKAAGGAPTPAPAPGPAAAKGPSFSPTGAPSPSTPAPPEPLSPRTDAAPTPPAPTTNGGAPSGSTGNRAGVTPSAARPSYSVSPLHIVAVLGAIALKFY